MDAVRFSMEGGGLVVGYLLVQQEGRIRRNSSPFLFQERTEVFNWRMKEKDSESCSSC